MRAVLTSSVAMFAHYALTCLHGRGVAGMATCVVRFWKKAQRAAEAAIWTVMQGSVAFFDARVAFLPELSYDGGMIVIPLPLWREQHYRLLTSGLNLIVLSLVLLKAPAALLLLAEVAALLASWSSPPRRTEARAESASAPSPDTD